MKFQRKFKSNDHNVLGLVGGKSVRLNLLRRFKLLGRGSELAETKTTVAEVFNFHHKVLLKTSKHQ